MSVSGSSSTCLVQLLTAQAMFNEYLARENKAEVYAYILIFANTSPYLEAAIHAVNATLCPHLMPSSLPPPLLLAHQTSRGGTQPNQRPLLLITSLFGQDILHLLNHCSIASHGRNSLCPPMQKHTLVD